ncbi:heme-binding protein 2-like [Sinocyclocheilus anshuiensis]|uniref:heme-binding protein 2-like n=1 Tax=Sinocyclocheilus anshuiensis TaxID=1608454 RepID=UPI0007B9CACA|nr:PREDICTED: heme-binding protein 2-like [Sinocyclocheilus anshuiensis]
MCILPLCTVSSYNMICLTGVIVLLFAVTVDGRVGDSSESSYCTETKECFLFDLVCAGKDYEFAVTSISFRCCEAIGTQSTAPNAGAKIDMTAPVIIKVNDSASMWQSSVYALSFLLPSNYQANPPKPTDPSVYFTDTPDMKVYVKSYGGYMMSVVARSQAQSLKTSLDNVQATYETEYYYNVGYNSPMKIMNRHNEAWYIVKGEPVCPKTE